MTKMKLQGSSGHDMDIPPLRADLIDEVTIIYSVIIACDWQQNMILVLPGDNVHMCMG